MSKEIIQNIVDKFLRNKNGRLEGQRIVEKWFVSRELTSEWDIFKKLNIDSAERLYQYLNDDDGVCKCGGNRRFIGFRDGYKPYCVKCAKTNYNHMKHPDRVDVSVEDVVDFVKTRDKYSTSKIVKISPKSEKLLRESVPHVRLNASLSEVIYNIEHKLEHLPICKVCNKPHDNFYSSIDGYKETHKGECAYTYGHTAGKELRSNAVKRRKFDDMIQKYNIEGYTINIPTVEQYINGETNVEFTHDDCGHTFRYDLKYQGHLRCPKCFPIRSKQQYLIYDFVSDHTNAEMNNRQLLKPKELDILTDKFAVEYDGQTFHSFGINSHPPLNNFKQEDSNCHLEKTELCEAEGVQLFRIFSSEWIDKSDIWKSILMSKMNATNRIFARKCEVKGVNNSVARSFVEKNHLQGHVNASINIGLFYNDELVSLMTFGKVRRSKWKGDKNYELYRFCTKLNMTVVGGGSKLIKYFERKYQPNLLMSYANRRWSQGNVYEKLGFEFKYNTKPNYFYFKGGDDAKLLSREQFQKHKLSDKLNVFDPNLTETENMYNNGYRKIYDCGNKVFVKIY